MHSSLWICGMPPESGNKQQTALKNWLYLANISRIYIIASEGYSVDESLLKADVLDEVGLSGIVVDSLARSVVRATMDDIHADLAMYHRILIMDEAVVTPYRAATLIGAYLKIQFNLDTQAIATILRLRIPSLKLAPIILTINDVLHCQSSEISYLYKPKSPHALPWYGYANPQSSFHVASVRQWLQIRSKNVQRQFAEDELKKKIVIRRKEAAANRPNFSTPELGNQRVTGIRKPQMIKDGGGATEDNRSNANNVEDDTTTLDEDPTVTVLEDDSSGEWVAF